MEPTLSQVIEVVRNSSGEHRKPIDSNTLIEADLHICGIDGEDLLEDCEEAFGVQLATEEDGYRKTFSLAENEYLFTGEGIDFFGNDSNLLIVFYVQIMPDDFVMQLHRF
ncbi:hypothetical protein [Enterobacter kobei]|uniref:hypothetical protein n=3 Tax=Enterobacter kobei TaxID=208224 RepID=UPI001FCE4D43|nr:hypothetical protein [Enterobacter kobei]